MKSVVMIAHNFPPEGNAGAYRVLRFVRCLPNHGWQSVVITLATDSYERYDPQLLSLVPPKTAVIRVRNPDPWKAFQQWRGKCIQQKLSGVSGEEASEIRAAHQASFRSSIREMVRKAESWVYHPDTDMAWIQPAVRASIKYSNQERPNVIWASAGPVSSFVVAQKVSQSTGIPYVLDFRDSWTITYNDFEDRRPVWAKRYEQRRMRRLLEKAQSIIFRSHAEAECYWHAYKGAVDPSKVYIIPNGYEGAIDEFVPLQSQRCEILYTGTLSDYRYDTLLKGLSLLKQSSPDQAKKLHVSFIGEGTDAVQIDAAALGLSEMVTTEGPKSHEEIIRLSKQAHVLLILGRPTTMRGYELFAGAKLFGYLKAGMPIIGVLPPDETKNVLLRVGVTTVADVESQSQIVTVLSKLIDAWSQNKLTSLVPNRAACKMYSSNRQGRELVRAFDGSPAAEPFVPGSTEIPATLRFEISKRIRQSEQRRAVDATHEITRSRA